MIKIIPNADTVTFIMILSSHYGGQSFRLVQKVTILRMGENSRQFESEKRELGPVICSFRLIAKPLVMCVKTTKLRTMFQTELDLTKAIFKALNAWEFQGSPEMQYHVFTELNLGYWVADLVLVRYDESDALFRKAPLTIYEISLLNFISKSQSPSIEKLPDAIGASKSKCIQTLKRLLEEWFVAMDEDNISIKIVRDYEFAVRDCFAIEAKLSNWRRALNQAHRYKWFSNESYVFMPIENVWPALKNIELFKELGVGLASVSSDCKIKVEYKPRKVKPICEKRSMLLNEMILTVRGQKSLTTGLCC